MFLSLVKQSTGRKRPPVFQSLEYKVKVGEDFPEGSHIFTGKSQSVAQSDNPLIKDNQLIWPDMFSSTVRAIDSDKGNNIKEKYSLVPSKSGQEANIFSVNQEHGWITLVNKLDYEVRPYLCLN